MFIFLFTGVVLTGEFLSLSKILAAGFKLVATVDGVVIGLRMIWRRKFLCFRTLL